ncbi:MAG TPA: peptidoglycan-binding domain-containing protein [Beijerinckia sp.]|nr:peptidoglycan-binding domain-containing protein [Beijerinckia sp.]
MVSKSIVLKLFTSIAAWLVLCAATAGASETGLEPRFAHSTAPARAGEAPALPQSGAASFAAAQRAFASLAIAERFDLQLLLIAAGYLPAIRADEFNEQLFGAILHFQAENGLEASGVADSDFLEKLRSVAMRPLRRWQLKAQAHPLTGTRLWVPAGLGLTQRPSSTGVEWATADNSLQIGYDFVPHADLAFAYRLFQRELGAPFRIKSDLVRREFFAIAAVSETRNSYVAFHSCPGGVIGFTLVFAPSKVTLGDRLALLMSDLFEASLAGLIDEGLSAVLGKASTTAYD